MDPEPSLTLLLTNLYPLIGYISIFLLLLGSALVSAAEVALFSLTQNDLDEIEKTNSSKAAAIKLLLEKPKKLLATILVTNNTMNVGAVVMFTYLCKDLFANWILPEFLLLADIVLVTFVILIFCELVPKIYASRENKAFATFIAVPLLFLSKLLTPISLPMRNITIYLHDRLGKQKSKFSVDRLSQALELTSSEGTTDGEKKILAGIVSFGNTETRQIMSPRIDIFGLEINESFAQIVPKILDKGFSRIPVYNDSIDAIEGVLFVKDLIPYINKEEFDWKDLIREPFFVPENKKLDDLLKDFQVRKNHLAVVVDEYGGTSGIVSLEDVIEEIVGDISDEFDDENVNYTIINDNTFMFEGKTNLRDFYRIANVNSELFDTKKGEAETIAGMLLEVFGNFPKKGQKIAIENCTFTVESVDKKRVKQIMVVVS